MLRQLIVAIVLLSLGSTATAYFRLLPGQRLHVDAVESTISEVGYEGRKICNRFNTHCFGYGHPVTPLYPVLWRKSDNFIVWCHSAYTTGGTQDAYFVSNVVMRGNSAYLASHPSAPSDQRVFIPRTDPTQYSFRWIEIDDSGNLVLYESVVAYRLFPSPPSAEDAPAAPKFAMVNWQLWAIGGSPGYLLEQVWDGPLIFRTTAGQTILTLSNTPARYIVVDLEGHMWSMDREDSPVWEFVMTPMSRPAYWRTTSDGNMHLVQGREISRIVASGTPPSQCNLAPSVPTGPAPAPGGSPNTPSPAATKMTRLVVPGGPRPTATPAAVNHSSPW